MMREKVKMMLNEVFDEGDAKKDLVAIDWNLAGTSMARYGNGGPGGLTGILAGTKTMAKFRERRTRMNRQPFYGTPGRKKRWEEAFQKFFDANHDFETWSQVAIDETRWTELLPQYVAWRMNRSGLNKLSPGEDPDNIYILKTDFDERDLKNAENCARQENSPGARAMKALLVPIWKQALPQAPILKNTLMALQRSQKLSWMQQEKLFCALLRCHLVFLQIRIWSRDIFSVDILNVVHTPVAQVPHSNRVKM